MKEIVLAAFKVTESNSVAYLRRKTLPGFLQALEKVIKEQEPDYISIRVIRESEGTKP